MYSPRAEINLGAIAANVGNLKQTLTGNAMLMAVTKANAYGHGAIEVTRTALENGASSVGVARLEEAIALRKAGITAPILVFGSTPPVFANELQLFDLTATVSSAEEARALARCLHGGPYLKLHLNVDTGMGRLGCFAQAPSLERMMSSWAIVEEVKTVAAMKHVALEGIYTHFSSADQIHESNDVQLAMFGQVLDALAAEGCCPRIRHAANSAACIALPDSHFDMVRTGLAMYGLCPFEHQAEWLVPALSLKTRVQHCKEVPPGTNISYGNTYQTSRHSRIATIALGYGDGYDRGLSGKADVLIRGQRAPILGRVCMDLTMVDVTDVPGVQVGDEVVIIGRQGNGCITAEELAAILGTINYEITTALSARVERSYVANKSTCVDSVLKRSNHESEYHPNTTVTEAERRLSPA